MSNENARKASLTVISHTLRLLYGAIIAIAFISFSLAEQLYAADQYVTIVMSPEVKQKLQKVTPAERNKIEQAIRTGNRYVQLRFNGQGYIASDDPDGDKEWQKTLAPLMAMSQEKWANYVYNNWIIEHNSDDFSRSYGLVVCMNVLLNEISIVEKSTTLKYRAKLTGAFPKFSQKNIRNVDFSYSGKQYDIQLLLNNKGKITNEHAENKYLASSYYIKRKSLHRQYKNYIINKQNSINKNNDKYIKIIDQLDESIHICSY
ncbi:MAG: hypothetical protein LWW87_13405 [Geobacteraceae bacterium]|nr:hypothetical protein [Geobacteraceae bacterium]